MVDPSWLRPMPDPWIATERQPWMVEVKMKDSEWQPCIRAKIGGICSLKLISRRRQVTASSGQAAASEPSLKAFYIDGIAIMETRGKILMVLGFLSVPEDNRATIYYSQTFDLQLSIKLCCSLLSAPPEMKTGFHQENGVSFPDVRMSFV